MEMTQLVIGVKEEITAEERAPMRADMAREREERVKRLGPWTPGVVQGGVQ
jgi:hypothetical protein